MLVTADDVHWSDIIQLQRQMFLNGACAVAATIQSGFEMNPKKTFLHEKLNEGI